MEKYFFLMDWISIVKVPNIPNAIYRANTILIKSLMEFFKEIEQIILKLIWSHKNLQIAKTILRKIDKVEGIMFPDFKIY